MSNSVRAIPRCMFVLAIVLFLSAIAPPVHASGRREDPMSKADQLISDRRYNEAILALTSLIKADPKRFDEAQRRLQRIVRMREEYNAVAGELLDILVNDPTNDERKLAMIRRLEELETAPNRAAREFLVRTKETALFTYNRAQFERIMADGRSLIDRGEYVAAARRYTDGFTLYREEFDAAGYGSLIVSRVDGSLQNVKNEIGRFDPLISRVTAATKQFEATLSSASGAAGLDPSRNAYASTADVFLEFASVRNAAASAGRGLENQFLLLQGADKELGENSFLPFAYRFVLGRKTEIRPEGVLGAMDTLWIDAANRTQGAAAAAADRAYASALSVSSSGDHLAAAESFETCASYAELAQQATGLWAAVAGPETSPALTSYGRSILAGKPPAFLKYRSLARAARFRAAAERDRLALAAIIEAKGEAALGLTDAEATDAALAASRKSLVALAGRIDGELAEVNAYAAQVTAFRDAKIVDDSTPAFVDASREAFASLSRETLASEVEVAVHHYSLAAAALEASLVKESAEIDRGRTLLEGDKENGPKYPTESIPVLQAAEAGTGKAVASAASLLAGLRAEPSRISSDARALAVIASIRDLGERSGAEQARSRAALGQARDRSSRAESARVEGDRRYEEARSALSRLNFDLARERIQRAGERYDFSLSIQESASLRAERDQKLLALSAEISKTENEAVVRDVRRLITQAKTSYFAGVFDRAEESLVQAQNRWRTTNVADEPEVAYWLTLVRGALSIKTGRTIPPTAPLYAEMSQLLSFARLAYDQGRELLAARRKTDALARFDEAKKKIQAVRIVFPINQEASLLDLRIDQLIDPDAFNEVFRRKVGEAQASLKSRPQEAYSELQDLAELNPRYPGLRAIIEKAEIDLGLRLPPPDPKALARSAELSRAARRIVDANLRGQFPVALEQLNEALKLDPNNEAAVSLKDRIQTDLGGQATVVLSSASERDYQRAVQELQKGNTIVALAIVEQLLQDDRNKNSSRILELQRRIQARL